MSVPDQRALIEEEKLLNEPMYRDLRPRVVEFIERMRTARTAKDWVNLHRDLLIEFGARQDAADETLPAARENVRAKIRELAQRNPKPLEEIRAQQKVLERVGNQELVARASQHMLRQIGDGIAWRALRYDRRAISILGAGERVGRLAQGVGRDAELAALGELWEDEGVFAIHNDMTNCLRHGDLTAVRENDGSLDVTLIEVKAGPRPEDTPQLQRLARATELLREGRQVSDAGVVHVSTVPAPYETYLDTLPGLIATAREEGFAWSRPHECLLIGAVDYLVIGQDPGAFNALSNTERAQVGWASGESDTLDWTASLRRMRDRGWSFSSLAPFTIFPLDTEDVADLSLGFLDMAYSLHLPALERALRRDGVEVQVRGAGDGSVVFLEGTRREIGVRVPAHLREQMMIELMTPDALFALIDHVLDLNEAYPQEANDLRVVTFADETSVWE